MFNTYRRLITNQTYSFYYNRFIMNDVIKKKKNL